MSKSPLAISDIRRHASKGTPQLTHSLSQAAEVPEMAVSAASSLTFNRLTSLPYSKLGSLRQSTAISSSFTPLKLTNKKFDWGPASLSFSVVCRALSVEPHTEIEGLNIADDVTQVEQKSQVFAARLIGISNCGTTLDFDVALCASSISPRTFG